MGNFNVVSALKKGGITLIRTKAVQTFLAVFSFSRTTSTGDKIRINVPVILDGHESPACAYFECVADRVPLVVRDPATGKACLPSDSECVENPVDDTVIDAIDNFIQDKVLNDIFNTYDWRSKKCHYTSMPWYKNGERLQNIFKLEEILSASPGISDYEPMAKADLIPFVESLGFDASALSVSLGSAFVRDYSAEAATEEGAALVAEARRKWSFKYKTVDDLDDFQKMIADAILHNEVCNFINIYGPSGNGKTSDVEIVCSVLGIPYLNLTGDPGVTVDDLMGCLTMETDAQGHTHTVWNKDAPLYKARVRGWVVNIAEIMQYNQPAKAQFNSMFDETKVFVAENGKVLCQQSPNFVVIGSFNPGAASNELFDNSTKSRALYFKKLKLNCSDFADVVGSKNERCAGRKFSYDFYRKLYNWIDFVMTQRNVCNASADINTRDAIIFTNWILTRPFTREEFGEALFAATLNKLGDASEESMKCVVELCSNPDIVKKVDDLYKLYDFKVIVEATEAPDFDDLMVAGQSPSGVIVNQAFGSNGPNQNAETLGDWSDMLDSDLFDGTSINIPAIDEAPNSSGSSTSDAGPAGKLTNSLND